MPTLLSPLKKALYKRSTAQPERSYDFVWGPGLVSGLSTLVSMTCLAIFSK
ncbi:unnamed protein product [Spirodela intermedia]|uniref:Uncharacterized protein n=1 Tax=Spirodela intermedia TaxID=51605 RepID=A0A7I8JZM9_SPIIN|nr:unnamed protein product [Spirodela intermedia]